ncbi:MAG: hypothetical protein WAZ12_05075 [Candidatus Absconditicoccaceae bacterium]
MNKANNSKNSKYQKENKSNKKNTEKSDYQNFKDKIIYINSDDAEVTIGYDLLKQTRYVQINSIK